MNCNICGKPVVLTPSAKVRSERTGLPVSYFTKLFPAHSSCVLKKRDEQVRELMKKKIDFVIH